MDNKAMMEELKKLKEENTRLKATRKAPATSLKVTEKGGMSMYGLGRWPVTLYKSQWAKVIEKVKSGEIEKFMQENDSKLLDKIA